MGGAHYSENAEGSIIVVNDNGQNNGLDYATTIGHEITHAQIAQGTIEDRGDLNEAYAGLMGEYAADNYGFSFSQNDLGILNTGNTNNHVGNDNSELLNRNTEAFRALAQNSPDNVDYLLPEVVEQWRDSVNAYMDSSKEASAQLKGDAVGTALSVLAAPGDIAVDLANMLLTVVDISTDGLGSLGILGDDLQLEAVQNLQDLGFNVNNIIENKDEIALSLLESFKAFPEKLADLDPAALRTLGAVAGEMLIPGGALAKVGKIDVPDVPDVPNVFEPGLNITPNSTLDRYPEIGGDGTFVTDRDAIERTIGPIPEGATEITIPQSQADRLESELGLNPGSLESKNTLSIIPNIAERCPRCPVGDAGNDLFLGNGQGLPGGDLEFVIDSIPSNGGDGIRQVTIKVEPDKAETPPNPITGSIEGSNNVDIPVNTSPTRSGIQAELDKLPEGQGDLYSVRQNQDGTFSTVRKDASASDKLNVTGEGNLFSPIKSTVNPSDQLAINYADGRKFQTQFTEALSHVGAAENKLPTTVMVNGQPVTTIPDLWGRNVGGIVEVKNVINISQTNQLRAQAREARNTGQPMNLVVSPRTINISQPTLDLIENTGGAVYRFDPITGKMTTYN